MFSKKRKTLVGGFFFFGGPLFAIPRLWPAVMVFSVMALSCHRGDALSSMFSGENAYLECDEETFFSESYEDCLQRIERERLLDRFDEQIARDAQSQQAKLASLAPSTTGMVYNFRSRHHKGSCLSEENGKWFWRACDAIALGQQFYIGDRQKVTYWLEKDKNGTPIMLDAIAFRLEVRASVDSWFQLSRCEEDQTPENDGCVDLDDDQSLESAQSEYVQCLSVDKDAGATSSVKTTDCLKASYFIALPSKFGTNEALEDESAFDLTFNQKDNRYVSLVAIINSDINARIMTADGTLIDSSSEAEQEEGSAGDFGGVDCNLLFESGDYQEYTPEELEILCPDKSFEEQPETIVDISEAFKEHEGCSYLMHILSDKFDRQVKAICPDSRQSIAKQQDKIKDTHLFLATCSLGLFGQDAECVNDHSIKKLYDHFDELENGYITQITKGDDPSKCTRVHPNRGSVEFIDCSEGRNDDIATQFRVITMGQKADANDFGLQFSSSPSVNERLNISMVKLQSVANPKLCIHIDGGNAIPCDNLNPLSGAGVYELNPASGGLNDSMSLSSFFLHHCSSVSSHSENNTYDCRYEVPGKLKRWARLGMGLSFLGLIALPGVFIVEELALSTISLIASIPSFVFDGMVCASGERNIMMQGCIGLGVGLGVELGFFAFSLRTLKRIPARYFTWVLFDPTLANFVESYKFFTGTDRIQLLLETANLSKISKTFAYMASRMSRAAGKGGAESGAESVRQLMYGSFINAVKREKYSYKELTKLLQTMWDGAKGACGRISCRHPLSFFPKPSGFKRFVEVELVEKTLPEMSLSTTEKQNIRILLSPDASQSAIESARSSL